MGLVIEGTIGRERVCGAQHPGVAWCDLGGQFRSGLAGLEEAKQPKIEYFQQTGGSRLPSELCVAVELTTLSLTPLIPNHKIQE